LLLLNGDNLKRGFIRGGNWNNTSNAGAFNLNLNNSPSNRNNNIGFRCASDYKKGQNEWYLFKD
jgi:formylglycine-generating enzyme required for sulfatase activity